MKAFLGAVSLGGSWTTSPKRGHVAVGAGGAVCDVEGAGIGGRWRGGFFLALATVAGGAVGSTGAVAWGAREALVGAVPFIWRMSRWKALGVSSNSYGAGGAVAMGRGPMHGGGVAWLTLRTLRM